MEKAIFIICGYIPDSEDWEIIHAYEDEQCAKIRMEQLEKESDDRMRKQCDGTYVRFVEPQDREWRRYWIQIIPYKEKNNGTNY